MQKALGENISSFIKAGTKDNEELESLINHSKFNKKVLIATKVLDNGINIADEKLTNIVIMAWDEITFIQMLGRKRIDIENAQTVNLYIPIRFKKSFMSKLKQCEYERGEVKLHRTNISEFNKKYDRNLKKISKMEYLFYKDNNKGWKVNFMGLVKLYQTIDFSKDMIKKFDDLGKFAYIIQQLSWLDLTDTFDESNYIENVIIEDNKMGLEQTLEYAYENNIRYTKEEFKGKIGIDFEEILNRLDGGRTRNKGMKMYNKLFDTLELPYVVSNKRFSINNQKQTRWIITKN